MKNFEQLQQICLEEVLAVGIKPGNIVKWMINRRAKKRWGMCTKHRNGDCEIQIAEVLLEDERVSEQSCKETMIHEILHTCDGCVGHTGLWLQYANRMNERYGYNIKRTTSSTDKGLEEYEPTKQLNYRYCFVCETCGQTVYKKKACKFTRYYRDYTCLICGTKRAFHKVSKLVN